MSRREFRTIAREIAKAKGWVVDFPENHRAITAWFLKDGSDIAQAYMDRDCDPVGLHELHQHNGQFEPWQIGG